ncbi:MAG: hypothetical protein QOF44_1292 [Streptomyces sp.]|nr:hypothetical protein [Streptomyces sp.]
MPALAGQEIYRELGTLEQDGLTRALRQALSRGCGCAPIGRDTEKDRLQHLVLRGGTAAEGGCP